MSKFVFMIEKCIKLINFFGKYLVWEFFLFCEKFNNCLENIFGK